MQTDAREANVVSEVITCPLCGQRNRVTNSGSEVRCGACKNPLSNPFARRARENKTIFAGIAIAIVVVLVFNAGLFSSIAELKAQQEHEVEELRQEQEHDATAALETHHKMLSDTWVVSGASARRRHQQEFEARTKHDPRYAQSSREKVILKMEAISGDASADSIEVLKQVATLAAPKGATVKVDRGSSGATINVVFDLSSMTRGEAGAKTKHHSIDALKNETLDIMARIFRDLYDHCGNRGIQHIDLACTHMVTQTRYNVESDVVWEIFKCNVLPNPAVDWRRVPIHKVQEMFHVEDDDFPNIRIRIVNTP
jgi:hypothetical protein